MSVPHVRRRAALLCAAAVEMSLAGRVAAQATPEKVDTLGTIEVTASRGGTTLRQMPLHTTVITRQELAASPARTLDQVLRDVPGMNLSGAPFYVTDPTGQQTRLRGVTNSKVLMLVDGIPIHDPFYSTTQWFKMPLSGIERVEVVRGGSSSVWGNLAVAGVVNVITRKPSDNSAEADVSYQSFGTWNAAASKNFLVSPELALRVSGDVLTTDGYQTTPAPFLATVPGKSASEATNWNLQVAGYYSPSARMFTFARVGYHRQHEDIGGYKFGANVQKSPDLAAGMTHTLGETGHADLRVWAQWEQFDKQNGAACFLQSASACNTTATSSPLVQFANSTDWNPYRELGASVSATSPLGTLPALLQVGADYRRVAGEDTATTFNRPTTTNGAGATINRVSYGQGAQQFIGGFTQLKLFPAAGLEITANLRYDYWTNRNGRALLTRYVGGVPQTPSGGDIENTSKGSFNPSLALRYALTDRLSVRGAAYTAFRAPGLNNLYRSFSSTTSITVANPLLLPETLRGAEMGGDLELDALTLGATLFQYNTKDLIASYRIQDAASAPPEVVAVCGADLSNCPATVNLNTNGQDARSRGVELTARVRVARPLSVGASYAFTSSYYTSTTTGDPTHAQLGGVPKHVATLSAEWTPHRRASLSATLRYSGSMYLDVNHTIPQHGFALLGASASYGWTDRLTLYGTVANLTDFEYSDSPTTSAASQTLGLPRAFTGGVRWTL